MSEAKLVRPVAYSVRVTAEELILVIGATSAHEAITAARAESNFPMSMSEGRLDFAITDEEELESQRTLHDEVVEL